MKIKLLGKTLELQSPIRAHPAGHLLARPSIGDLGVGTEWAKAEYGEYYPRSVSVYSAIKLRGDALARAPLYVYRTGMEGGKPTRERVEPDHPLQSLLDRVNPFWTRGELWRATEVYLGLWGSAFWAIEYGEGGLPVELWPLRPDKTKVIPDLGKDYIKGFAYSGWGQGKKTFTPDEIVWMRYFNPMDEWAGLSPIAPLRLSLDMAHDNLQANRRIVANDQSPGVVFKPDAKAGQTQIDEFFERWAKKHRGPANVMIPAVLQAGWEVENMGFSPKEMEYVQNLRWSLEEVARAYNVPMPMLHDLSRATYANIKTARQSFWEDCIVPQLLWYQGRLQESLVPLFREPDLVVEFDTSAIEALQEDANDRAKRHQIYLTNAVLTPNEVREELGREPIEGGEVVLQPAAPGQFALPSAHVRKVDRTEDFMRSVEADFRALLDPSERRFQRLQNELFNAQMDDIQHRLNQYRSVSSPAKAMSSIVQGNGHRLENRAEPPSAAVLFEPEQWMELYIARGRPFHAQGLAQAGVNAAAKWKLGIAFDVNRPLTQRWLTDRATWWANKVNTTTADGIMTAVKKANELGESIPQLAARIKDYRAYAQAARAPTIARTEMVAAQNEGHLQAYEQAELDNKEWLTAEDDRVRSHAKGDKFDHESANGQIRRIREDFDISGEKLRAPGQGGSPGNVCNCRCQAIPGEA